MRALVLYSFARQKKCIFYLRVTGFRGTVINMPTNADKSYFQNNPPLNRSSRFTLQEQLVKILTEKIARQEYPAGERLPSVRALAEMYSVSRETAKLAIGLLQKQGLVEIMASRGAYVAEKIPEHSQRQKTGTFGFVLDLGSSSEETNDIHIVYDKLLQEFDSRVRDSGYYLLTSSLCYGASVGTQRLAGLIDRIDGLFVAGLINPDFYEYLKRLPVPVVAVLPNIKIEDIDNIGIDSAKTWAKAALRLLEGGHRKLVYVDGPVKYYQKKERIAGCRRAIDEYSDSEALELLEVEAEGWTPETAKKAFAVFLREYGAVDAVLAANDVIASGVAQACHEDGLQVPDAISILGAKNTILSTSINPNLSSIDYHFDHIARIAVRRMLYRINEDEVVPTKIEFAGSLVERDSSRDKND